MPILYSPFIEKTKGANSSELASLSDALLGTEELSANLEMYPRNCTVAQPPLLSNIKPIDVKGEFIAFASPDSTYAVTRKLIDNAKSEIIIGIYDFTAEYVQDLLLQAMQRDVKITLMLDVDSDEEKKIMNNLAKFGAITAEAPSCANSQHIRYYPCCHEKVIIIDQSWCIVQSGNYSKNSIPFNERDGGDFHNFVKGNRDMGIAIKSSKLCKFFTNIIKNDMALEVAEEASIAASETFAPLPALLEAVPKKIPSSLFPSKSFQPSEPIAVTPVLSPDNYMDIIPKVLSSAKKSIIIENQYIKSSQTDVSKLLSSIKKAIDKNSDLDVRIILGKMFSQKDYDKEKINIKNIAATYGLELGENIRYIDTDRFVHCHNKLIIVDNEKVLVSSQNWSDSAVSKNREAGLLIQYPDIAEYYSSIFESDWSTALQFIPKPGKAEAGIEEVAAGNFMSVVAADYQEV